MAYLDCDASLKQYANRILGLFDQDKRCLGEYTTKEITDSAIKCLKSNNISSIENLKKYCGDNRSMDSCDIGGIKEFIEKYKYCLCSEKSCFFNFIMRLMCQFSIYRSFRNNK